MLGVRIDLNTGRYLSIGRVALAFTTLIVAISDPQGVGLRFEPDDIVALAAIAASLVLLAVCYRSWWWQHRLRHVETALDITLVVAILFTFDATALGKHGIGVLAIAMVGTRIGIVEGVRAMQLLFAGYVALFLLLVIGPVRLHPDLPPDFLVLRILALVGLIAAVLSLVMSNRSVAGIVSAPSLDNLPLSGYLAAATGAVKAALQHRQTTIDWQSRTTRSAVRIDHAGTENLARQPLIWPLPSIDRANVAALLHDFDRARTVVLFRDGRTQGFSRCPADESNRSSYSSLGSAIIAAPMRGATGEGLLLASAAPAIHSISLEAVAEMACSITYAIDRHVLSRAQREADLFTLRQSVAMDLHDSVAQTLTGTRFWLNGIARSIAEAPTSALATDIGERIGTLNETIAFEQAHVHDIIARLREGEDNQALTDLRQELPELIDKLAARWQVSIGLVMADDLVTLPVTDSHEIKHLLREAIANAVRHGQASRIDIELGWAADVLSIAVTDNGRGFASLEEAQQPWSIATRLGQLGGELNLAAPAVGTRIEMTIPCRSNRTCES